MDRQNFAPLDTISYMWRELKLPLEALEQVVLKGQGFGLPSSFKVGHLAQSSIALATLSTTLVISIWRELPIPKITVSLDHACIDFLSERLYILNGIPAPTSFGTIGGIHQTEDGYARLHDGFLHHRNNALKILGLTSTAKREDVAEKMLTRNAEELETKAFSDGACITKLRSFDEWDLLPQAKAIDDFPIRIRKIKDSVYRLSERIASPNDKCLEGLRVIDMSRVIAAPVAGKTLAAYGADVIWITSPNLPALPEIDIDMGRGKRTVQLDITNPQDKSQLLGLLRTADVFIQGYRPGSLAAQGLSPTELTKWNPNLVVASLSAYGTKGPWAGNRGFDSLVQNCTGINVSEAEYFGAGEASRPLPCQALDHGAGYLLVTGIMAALYKRSVEGGAYEVEVSLAGVGKYLRSLGRYSGKSGFGCRTYRPGKVKEFLETKMTGFGELTAVRYPATVEGVEIGWNIMPKPLGSDEPVWLE